MDLKVNLRANLRAKLWAHLRANLRANVFPTNLRAGSQFALELSFLRAPGAQGGSPRRRRNFVPDLKFLIAESLWYSGSACQGTP